MIKIPKKQLFSETHLLAVLLFVILLIFLIIATTVFHSFFSYLSTTLFFLIIYLVYLYRLLDKKRGDILLEKEEDLETMNLLQAEINEETQVIKSYRKKITDYRILKDLTEKLCLSLHLEDVTKVLSFEVNKLFGAEDVTVTLYLFETKTGEVGIPSEKGKFKNFDMMTQSGDIYDQFVIKTMKPLLVQDSRNDFRFDTGKIKDEASCAIRSLMSVPLFTENKALGLLRLDSLHANYFTTEDMRLLTTICDLGSIAIENAQLYERVEELGKLDSLTGLYVRRYFFKVLPQRVKSTKMKNMGCSAMMVDLDYFKQYNDTYGHIAGDMVLKAVAGILREVITKKDELICRFGGEEFLAVLPDCSLKLAANLAEEIRECVEKETFILRRKKTSITVSIGVASFMGEECDIEKLIQKADDAMYKAKHRGRNRVCISD